MLLVEAMAAAAVGFVILWLILQPLVRPGQPSIPIFEPIDPEETPKGIALVALKEIEFDRETGKLSDADYELLKAKYTAAALEALRGEEMRDGPPREAVVCATCGPRPEPDAIFCSTCGRPLTHRAVA